ncbi:MAG: DNA internalization-related competence protein ComEC/Rec2 [Desulfovibrionaceae bacterium]
MTKAAPDWEQPPPLQALLFWQSCVVCGVLGLLALHWPIPAVWALGLLLWADARVHCWPLPTARACVRLVLALSCFASAWHAGISLLPPTEELPPWAVHQKQDKTPPRLRGVVDSVQGLTDQRLRIILTRVSPDNPKTADNAHAVAPTLSGKVVWTWDAPVQRPIAGETWAFSLPLNSTDGFRNSGTADWGFAARTQNHLWRVWSKQQRGNPQKLEHFPPATPAALERENLRQNFFAALKPATDSAPIPQGQAIIPALLFGDRSALDNITIDLFTRGTLIHSLALSGQHLGVTVLLAVAFIALLGRLRPELFLHVPRLKAVMLCALPLALAYLWLGNAPSSLLRAACMMVLLSLYLWRNSAVTTLDILCGAVFCLLLWTPLSVFEIGLQLSVICVGTIALVMPIIRSLPRVPRDGSSPRSRVAAHITAMARALCSICLISLAIQIALLPINLLIFHTASPWFFLNVLWLPVLGCFVLPASVLALGLVTLQLPTAAHVVITIAAWPCELLLRLLHTLNDYKLLDEILFLRPHWTALLGYTALVCAAALLWGRTGLPAASRRLTVAGAVLLLIGPLIRYQAEAAPHISLHMLDVGQGQALALQFPHGQSLLVDGGGSYSTRFDVGQAVLSPSLTYNQAPRVGTLINTHPHMDHLKGLLYVRKKFQTRMWHDNTSLAAGDRLLLCTKPRLILEVLHPQRGIRHPKENDNSLVLRLVAETAQGKHGLALLTGDIEQEGLNSLLARRDDLRAEVLVLPHHGSNTSFSPKLYAAVKPHIALISAGNNNRYGCPAPKVLKNLQEQGVAVYLTAKTGEISVRWTWDKAHPLAHTAQVNLPAAPPGFVPAPPQKPQ